MFYDSEPEEQKNTISSLALDGRFITASAYLRGLRWHDQPTELMPRDAVYLRSAKRFYSSLSEDDQNIIDSYSDNELFKTMDIRQRNARFRELAMTFMFRIGTESKYTILMIPPVPAEKGKESNEPY